MSTASNQEIHIYQIRPRFQIETPYTKEVLTGMIRANLEQSQDSCSGWAKSGYATIKIPDEDQHYWSPQLNLSIEDLPNGSLIRGSYGPKPSVWTMFMFFYFLLGTAILIITVIGFANLSIGFSGAILWMVPMLIILFLSLYLIAYFGQKLARDQMLVLHDFLESAIGKSFPDPPR